MGNTKPSDLIDEWQNSRHNLPEDYISSGAGCRSMPDGISGTPRAGKAGGDIDLIRGVISEMREVGEKGSKKWRILAWADRLEMNLPSMSTVLEPVQPSPSEEKDFPPDVIAYYEQVAKEEYPDEPAQAAPSEEDLTTGQEIAAGYLGRQIEGEALGDLAEEIDAALREKES